MFMIHGGWKQAGMRNGKNFSRKHYQIMVFLSHPKNGFTPLFIASELLGGRIQDTDLEIIRLAVKENYPVAIALTKVDLISDGDENKLLAVLKDEFGDSKQIIIGSVCSESKVTRSKISKPFGKDVIEKIILDHVAVSIGLKLPDYLYEQMSKELKLWQRKAFQLIENETGFFSDDVESELKRMAEKLNDTLSSLWTSTIQDVLLAYGGALGLCSEDLLHGIGFKKEYLHKNPETSLYDGKGFWEGLGITLLVPIVIPFAVVGFPLWAKDTNKDGYRKMVNRLVENIDGNLRKMTLTLANRLNKDFVSPQSLQGSKENYLPDVFKSLFVALGLLIEQKSMHRT